MALLYRAIWTDEQDELIDTGSAVFGEWLARKGIETEVPSQGTAAVDGCEVTVARAHEDGVGALRISLNEERAVRGGSERWTTTAHWMTDGTQGWVWVDLEWVSDDAYARHPDVVAPNLIGMLFDADGAAPDRRLGHRPSRVGSGDVDALVDWLFDAERPAPVVVFSVDPKVGPDGYADRVRETARRLAGCVDVRMLTATSEDAFVAATHGHSLSVFDGAVRVYLPGIDREDPQPWRHRYVQAHLLSERPHTAAGRISQLVLPRVVAQRPPMLYRTHIKRLLDESVGVDTDWQGLAEDLDATLSEVQAEVERLREEKDLALMEAVDSEREAADAMQRLDALRAQVRTLGEAPEAIEQLAMEEATARSCAEAVEIAGQLEHLALHPEAARDIDRMDQSPDAELWGQRLLNHLRSLDAYAADKGPGYQTWCETSGHPRVISPKFISMTESESVCTRPNLRRHRLLPVDQRVDASGQIEMFAHIKSVQGGGMQIPRIYFHDDTKGVTEKVHIGFIGPHDLMPNLQTN